MLNHNSSTSKCGSSIYKRKRSLKDEDLEILHNNKSQTQLSGRSSMSSTIVCEPNILPQFFHCDVEQNSNNSVDTTPDSVFCDYLRQDLIESLNRDTYQNDTDESSCAGETFASAVESETESDSVTDRYSTIADERKSESSESESDNEWSYSNSDPIDESIEIGHTLTLIMADLESYAKRAGPSMKGDTYPLSLGSKLAYHARVRSALIESVANVADVAHELNNLQSRILTTTAFHTLLLHDKKVLMENWRKKKKKTRQDLAEGKKKKTRQDLAKGSCL
jgi:hypothetical protein